MKNVNIDSISFKNIAKYAGAIVAYLAGAGFATGQESLQFFSAYGSKGALGVTFLSLIFYVWFCYTLMKDGFNLKGGGGVVDKSDLGIEFYCGKYLGRFFNIYISFFMFMVLVIMVSASGAIFFEYFQLNVWFGRIFLILITVISVILGLNSLINLVSKLAYFLIFFALIIGSANIIHNWDSLILSDLFLENNDITKAAPTWYISGIIFPSMGAVLIAPFLMKLGSLSNNRKEASFGGVLGATIFVIAMSVMAFSILASIEILHEKNIPMLVISQGLYPGVSLVFSLILLAAVISTAVPMLWLTSTTLVKNEKSMQFKSVVLVLAFIALIGSNYSFKDLINILYPISGYLGIVLFISVIIKQIRNKVNLR